MGLPLWPCFAVFDITALPPLPMFISAVVILLPVAYWHGRDILAFKFGGAAVWKTTQIGDALTWIRVQIYVWFFYKCLHLLYERREKLGKLGFECLEALRGLCAITNTDTPLKKLQQFGRRVWPFTRNTAEGDCQAAGVGRAVHLRDRRFRRGRFCGGPVGRIQDVMRTPRGSVSLTGLHV